MLTGAQVLLVVTSETGNIYDFSTPKFRAVVEKFKDWFKNACKDKADEFKVKCFLRQGDEH